MRRLVAFAIPSLAATVLAAASAPPAHAQTYGGQGYGAPGYGGQPYGGQSDGGQGYGAPAPGGSTYGPPDQGYGQGAPPQSDGRDYPPPGGRYDGGAGYYPDAGQAPPEPGAQGAPYGGYGAAPGAQTPRYADPDGYPAARGDQAPPPPRGGFEPPDGEYGAPRAGPDQTYAPPESPSPAPSSGYADAYGGRMRDGDGYAPRRAAPGAPLSSLLTCEGGGFGRDLGCRLSTSDTRRAEAATDRALATGAPQDWSNPRTGAYGRASVLADGYGRGGYSDLVAGAHQYGPGGRCRVVRESITPSGGRTESREFRACPAVGETYGSGYGGERPSDWTFSPL